MIKIMFVCHGNICRSPMAEFMMKDLVEKNGVSDQFMISSSATSKYEEGLRVHRGTRAILDRRGIYYGNKCSTPLKKQDYENYDYFIGMDEENRSNMQRILGGDPDGKISLLLDYTLNPRPVADPYWTGDFSATERDIEDGTKALFEFLSQKKSIK